MTCDDVRAIAPELALGIADGEQRAAALEHLADCAGCRRTLERLSRVTDELLMLTPEREPPPGFESRTIERVMPQPAPIARRSRRRRAAPMLAAAAAGAALTAAVLVSVFHDDRRIASGYRATLAEAGGKELRAAKLYRPGDISEGVAFAYDGKPSWVVVTLRKPWHSTSYDAELITDSGARIQLRSFALDPRTGSWGGAIPVSLKRVVELRLLGARRGDVLEAEFRGRN